MANKRSAESPDAVGHHAALWALAIASQHLSHLTAWRRYFWLIWCYLVKLETTVDQKWSSHYFRWESSWMRTHRSPYFAPYRQKVDKISSHLHRPACSDPWRHSLRSGDPSPWNRSWNPTRTPRRSVTPGTPPFPIDQLMFAQQIGSLKSLGTVHLTKPKSNELIQELSQYELHCSSSKINIYPG